MKIDLHCHTKKVKSGDGDGRNVSPELFRNKVLESDVKIVAITNHNLFDLEQYQALARSVEGNCQLWPGIEIDVKDTGNRWHLIVVVAPEKADDFSLHVNNLFSNDDLEMCTHNLTEIYTAFCDDYALYIAHFHKKPAVPEEDMEKLNTLVGESFRVFSETPDHRTMGVFSNYGYNVLVGSDVKEWVRYETCSFAELRLPVDSFAQFCMLAKRDSSVVETLLNRKQSLEVIAHPHESVDLPLKVYAEVNVLFGQKGTGKTQILLSIRDELLSRGLSCVDYIASERKEDFEALLKTQDMDIDLALLEINSCEQAFAYIASWNDSYVTRFTKYLDWYKTRGNNANKARMKITEATSISFSPSEHYEVHQQDKKRIDDVYHELQAIDLSLYIGMEDGEQLKYCVDRIKTSIYRERMKDLIEQYSVKLTNESINSIKKNADKSSETVSKPADTGMRKMVERRMELLGAVRTILSALKHGEYNTREKIGTLEDKGDIFVNRRYRMLCGESRAEEFTVGIRKLRSIQESLEYIRDNIFAPDLASRVQELTNSCEENNICSIQPFIGKSKQIVTSTGDLYSPSNGEKGILLLQKKLTAEADAYFLDEPELGMGNSYIDTSIRPMITALAKRRKYVIIATHNANIAVRTLPYMSIYRTHQNGEYSTYVGNPFSDYLVDVDDEENKKSWTEESLRSLEGSREAFYERRDIYESNGRTGYVECDRS